MTCRAFLRNCRRFALLLAAGLLLAGCVYLRLLELKHQLANFDRYVKVSEADGLTLQFTTPVLLSDDMAYFGLAPETVAASPDGSELRWRLRWIKDYAAPGEKPADYQVEADFVFTDGKLSRIHLPEHVFTFVPKELVVQALRSLGHASINKEKKSAHAALAAPGITPLTRADLLKFLGAPLETRVENGRPVLHYRYTGVSAIRKPGKIDFAFTLDPAQDVVLHLQGRMTHVENLQLDWPAPEKKEKKG